MASQNMEVTQNFEIVPVAEEQTKRQLGNAALEGYTCAEPLETHPYAQLQADLQHAIIGQPDAISSVVTALGRDTLRNPDRPVANLLFMGPTGVGKSETGKELARLLHTLHIDKNELGDRDDLDDENAEKNENRVSKEPFLKIDCSAFSNGHEVTALTGAPPSFVGREQKPWFDPKKEYGVVLLDEIEKGSKPLWDLLLQIMEDGELQSTGTGQTISFRNSIIIMTTNLGSEEMARLQGKRSQAGFSSSNARTAEKSKEQIRNTATDALKTFFRPEFINRFDERVVFGSLDDNQMGEVLDRYIEKANQGRYKDNRGIELTLLPELREALVTSTDDRHELGPRQILRKYEQVVESDLSARLQAGNIPEASTVYATLADEVTDLNDATSEKVLFYYKNDPTLKEYLEFNKITSEAPMSTELVPLHEDPDYSQMQG